MAEPRILLLLCILVLCLADSGFIRGQMVSGEPGSGRDHVSWCINALGGSKAAGTCLTSLGTQAVVPTPQAEVCGCSTSSLKASAI